MILDHDNGKPLYIQIAEWIETEILRRNLTTHDKVYSQYQLADMFTINPATAAKGLNRLADDEILYKKRGLGMFVSESAEEIILNRRKALRLQQLVDDLVIEARHVHVELDEIIEMIKVAHEKEMEGK
ncbi:GntR family transcriptional regulator [Alkalihalobacillus hemicellulosilyticus]|uniref:Transcriptional regulator n=1 Tax=Halalkalibacter hemicellulosilyticusJCM 9152 TaxID=1236971 RepID=W4QJT3_9BACI|nr:GntR family transcriptional regulator [Halalkalibacter hemicellulosilyticus]GAE31604.1 transcriptional regulator [Halalkalibacter hemicellulosilyticusJCM 9152]